MGDFFAGIFGRKPSLPPAIKVPPAPAPPAPALIPAIETERLALNIGAPARTTFDYVRASRVSHVRVGVGVRYLLDPDDFADDRRTRVPKGTGKTQRQFLLDDLEAMRLEGLAVALAFHSPPPEDPFGDGFPPFIRALVADCNAIGIRIVAVQPGNENNLDVRNGEGGFPPALRGLNDHERGMACGDMIARTRVALDEHGFANVETWTPGLIWTDAARSRAFLVGLAETCSPAQCRGIAVHAASFPPVHHLTGWADVIASSAWANVPMIATECASEALKLGDETGGSFHVQQVLEWMASPAGARLQRLYWYSAEARDDGVGLLWPDGRERLAATTFRTFPRQ
jgi:hypothetical protein